MTESTEKRIPTMRVVLTIYDKEVHVEGENLHTLRNSVIRNIERNLKKAAKIAKRNYLRKDRVAPNSENGKVITEGKKDSDATKDETVNIKDTDTKPVSIIDSLTKLGIKQNSKQTVSEEK